MKYTVHGHSGFASCSRKTVVQLGCIPEIAYHPTHEDRLRLRRLLEYYHTTLKQHDAAQKFLCARRIDDPFLINKFLLGYADRSALHQMPPPDSCEGGGIRGQLQRLGLIRPSGREVFQGSLVVPILDKSGSVIDIYGRRIARDRRPDSPKHITLNEPPTGMFNHAALHVYREVILCGSVLDAMTFWCAGFKNSVGLLVPDQVLVNGTDVFAKCSKLTRIVLVFRSTGLEQRISASTRALLRSLGLSCVSVPLPAHMDVNAIAMRCVDTRRAMQRLLIACGCTKNEQ